MSGDKFQATHRHVTNPKMYADDYSQANRIQLTTTMIIS